MIFSEWNKSLCSYTTCRNYVIRWIFWLKERKWLKYIERKLKMSEYSFALLLKIVTCSLCWIFYIFLYVTRVLCIFVAFVIPMRRTPKHFTILRELHWRNISFYDTDNIESLKEDWRIIFNVKIRVSCFKYSTINVPFCRVVMQKVHFYIQQLFSSSELSRLNEIQLRTPKCRNFATYRLMNVPRSVRDKWTKNRRPVFLLETCKTFDVRLIRNLEGSRSQKRSTAECERDVKISCTGETEDVDNDIYGTVRWNSCTFRSILPHKNINGTKREKFASMYFLIHLLLVLLRVASSS